MTHADLRISKYKTKVRGDKGRGWVKYHDTIIARWNPDYLLIDTGGWFTRTTADRVSRVLWHLGVCGCMSRCDWIWAVAGVEMFDERSERSTSLPRVEQCNRLIVDRKTGKAWRCPKHVDADTILDLEEMTYGAETSRSRAA